MGERGIAIGALTGRDFAGINLPVTVQNRTITLSADRAWAWLEGATNRIALDGDVKIAIGAQAYRAARAVVWLEPVEVIGMEGTPIEADQVAIVFEGVTAAGAAPGAPDAQPHGQVRLVAFHPLSHRCHRSLSPYTISRARNFAERDAAFTLVSSSAGLTTCRVRMRPLSALWSV